MPLPRRRRLVGLIGSESLRTFADNVLRVVVILLLIGPVKAEDDVQQATTAVNVAYTVPWIVLSILAGVLADRVSKGLVLRALKVSELVVMLLAAGALATGNRAALLGVVFLVGTLSALASPAKYGALPEIAPGGLLPRANGFVLLGTYVAIITGTALGGLLLDLFRPAPWAIALGLAALAAVGYGFAGLIPVVPPARVEGGVVETTVAGWRAIRDNVRLRLALLGNVGYWALAALVSQDLLVYAKTVLGLSDTGKSLLVTAIALGIGVGSVMAGLVSRGRIRLGQVPLGLALMSATALLFGLRAPAFGEAVGLLLVLGVGAGFYVVPLSALIQDQAPATARGAVLAVMNVIIFLGIGMGSAAAWALSEAGLSSTDILVVTAAVTGYGALYAGFRVPHLLRPPA